MIIPCRTVYKWFKVTFEHLSQITIYSQIKDRQPEQEIHCSIFWFVSYSRVSLFTLGDVWSLVPGEILVFIVLTYNNAGAIDAYYTQTWIHLDLQCVGSFPWETDHQTWSTVAPRGPAVKPHQTQCVSSASAWNTAWLQLMKAVAYNIYIYIFIIWIVHQIKIEND